jgi:hypothetical protein
MAVDWTVSRQGAMRFVRVDYTTRQELEELTTIQPGGSISRNLDTDLKEQGALSCVDPPSLGDDLIRIYYDVTDDDGNTESVVLATMHAVKASAQYTPAAQKAGLTLYSALLTLQQAALQESLTLPAASVAVDEAVDLCETLGLPVIASVSTKELTADASWASGTSYLKIINWLLDFAGFWSCQVDGWGRVVMNPYEAPGDRAPVREFTAGEDCTFLPDVALESDSFSVPNVCVLTSSNAGTVLVGSYENADPASPYSTVTRGREIVLSETVDDAVDEADLDARAEKRLIAATASTEKLTVKHAHAPVTIGDVVFFTWAEHGLAMRASIQSQEIALGPAALITSTLKRVWDNSWVS